MIQNQITQIKTEWITQIFTEYFARINFTRLSLLRLLFFVLIFLLSFSYVYALEFETKFAAEDIEELIQVQKENVSLFQEKLEDLITSVFPSLAPPVISEVLVSQITENSAVITWKTNIKSSSIVAYCPQEECNFKKDNPYTVEIGNMEERVTLHKVELKNLKPGTLYHFQVKSQVLPEVIGKSKDFTFSTLSAKIKLELVSVSNNEIELRWVTPKPTDSRLEYKNIKSGKILEVKDDKKVTIHVMKAVGLTPGTAYELKGSGYDENNILIETGSIVVTTKKDVTPPNIYDVRVNSALLSTEKERGLTIISWKTDEPANSIVKYSEGLGFGELDKATGLADEYVTDHNVIIPTKTGTIYRIQIVSSDISGNTAKTSVKIILTTRAEESIFDIMIQNFQETFKFLKRR
jgi:hypothetical protein